jgi:hypothetical protein
MSIALRELLNFPLITRTPRAIPKTRNLSLDWTLVYSRSDGLSLPGRTFRNELFDLGVDLIYNGKWRFGIPVLYSDALIHCLARSRHSGTA